MQGGYCVESDLEMSRTAVEEMVPRQLTASHLVMVVMVVMVVGCKVQIGHLYTDTGLSRFACSANTSPDLERTMGET